MTEAIPTATIRRGSARRTPTTGGTSSPGRSSSRSSATSSPSSPCATTATRACSGRTSRSSSSRRCTRATGSRRRGRIVRVGQLEPACEFEVWKVGGARTDISESRGRVPRRADPHVPGRRDDGRHERSPTVHTVRGRRPVLRREAMERHLRIVPTRRSSPGRSAACAPVRRVHARRPSWSSGPRTRSAARCAGPTTSSRRWSSSRS